MTVRGSVARKGAGEDGAAGAVLLLAAVVMLAVTVPIVVAVIDVSATAARARGAADAAALAAMTTSPVLTTGDHEDAVTAARTVARANGTRLVETDKAGWPLRFSAEVEAIPALPWVARLTGGLRERATAALRPATATPGQ